MSHRVILPAATDTATAPGVLSTECGDVIFCHYYHAPDCHRKCHLSGSSPGAALADPATEVRVTTSVSSKAVLVVSQDGVLFLTSLPLAEQVRRGTRTRIREHDAIVARTDPIVL
jgi:hypothetical protein